MKEKQTISFRMSLSLGPLKYQEKEKWFLHSGVWEFLLTLT